MAVDPDDKEDLVFPLGINGVQAKKSCFALMELIQTVPDEVPFDMGLGNADDKASELQVTLEDLFEEYSTSTSHWSTILWHLSCRVLRKLVLLLFALRAK